MMRFINKEAVVGSTLNIEVVDTRGIYAIGDVHAFTAEDEVVANYHKAWLATDMASRALWEEAMATACEIKDAKEARKLLNEINTQLSASLTEQIEEALRGTPAQQKLEVVYIPPGRASIETEEAPDLQGFLQLNIPHTISVRFKEAIATDVLTAWSKKANFQYRHQAEKARFVLSNTSWWDTEVFVFSKEPDSHKAWEEKVPHYIKRKVLREEDQRRQSAVRKRGPRRGVKKTLSELLQRHKKGG